MRRRRQVTDETKRGAEYTCAYCGETYLKEVDDAVAWEEYDANFPGEPHETAVVVCDDCYQQMVAEVPPPGMQR